MKSYVKRTIPEFIEGHRAMAEEYGLQFETWTYGRFTYCQCGKTGNCDSIVYRYCKGSDGCIYKSLRGTTAGCFWTDGQIVYDPRKEDSYSLWEKMFAKRDELEEMEETAAKEEESVV